MRRRRGRLSSVAAWAEFLDDCAAFSARVAGTVHDFVRSRLLRLVLNLVQIPPGSPRTPQTRAYQPRRRTAHTPLRALRRLLVRVPVDVSHNVARLPSWNVF